MMICLAILTKYQPEFDIQMDGCTWIDVHHVLQRWCYTDSTEKWIINRCLFHLESDLGSTLSRHVLPCYQWLATLLLHYSSCCRISVQQSPSLRLNYIDMIHRSPLQLLKEGN